MSAAQQETLSTLEKENKNKIGFSPGKKAEVKSVSFLLNKEKQEQS